MLALHSVDERSYRYLARPSHLGYQFVQVGGGRLRTRPLTYGYYPDISDPATQGCLLASVREILSLINVREFEWEYSGDEIGVLRFEPPEDPTRYAFSIGGFGYAIADILLGLLDAMSQGSMGGER